MTTVFPAEVVALMDAAQIQGRLVRGGPLVAPHPLSRCPNCNGQRPGDAPLVVQIEDPEVKTMTWWDDVHGWVRVKTYAPPCPVCVSQADIIRHLWQECGLEAGERTWRLEYLVGRPGKEVALEAALTLLAQTPAPAGWLTVYGDYGRGKSGLLKSLTAGFIRAGIVARYRRASDVLEAIRATYDDGAPTSQSAIERDLLAARFLALDEIDRTSDTPWAMETLHRLLDKRYNARGRQATALASNCSPADLPARLRYLASRMTDGRMVALGGQDLRGENEPMHGTGAPLQVPGLPGFADAALDQAYVDLPSGRGTYIID